MPDTNPLIPNKDHFIALETAVEMTTRYRAQMTNILATGVRDQNILPICETFNREAFDKVLKNDNCVGVRLYYSMDENLRIHMIVLGVDEENKDILPADVDNIEMVTNRLIIEKGLRCPMDCPPASPLNS